MLKALDAEGQPQAHASSISVAGTNGKGGTAAFLSAILHAHDRRPGLYTSPHIVDLRERFRVNGRPLPTDQIKPVAERVLETYGESGSGDVRLTFFELTTLMAALLLRDAGTDVDIYEVGLGGRLDAVNAIEPALSVITTLGLDHTEYLGDTIEKVATEKAGIFRPDAPAVIGCQNHPEALETLRSFEASEFRAYGEDFGVSAVEEEGEGATFWSDGGDLRIEGLTPQAPHPTRLANMATAIEAARVFLGDRWDPGRTRQGVARTVWPGRLDTRIIDAGRWGLDRDVELLIDAAHNPAAVDALFDWLNHPQQAPFDGAFASGLADKALDEMFEPLGHWDVPVWSCQLESHRAASSDVLKESLSRARLQGVAEGCAQGLRRACVELARTDSAHRPRLLVYGSIYLIGEVFEALGLGPDDLATETDAPRVEPAP
jgi:dihydrofolate synthase/folylpolyglutamate synthase